MSYNMKNQWLLGTRAQSSDYFMIGSNSGQWIWKSARTEQKDMMQAAQTGVLCELSRHRSYEDIIVKARPSFFSVWYYYKNLSQYNYDCSEEHGGQGKVRMSERWKQLTRLKWACMHWIEKTSKLDLLGLESTLSQLATVTHNLRDALQQIDLLSKPCSTLKESYIYIQDKSISLFRH